MADRSTLTLSPELVEDLRAAADGGTPSVSFADSSSVNGGAKTKTQKPGANAGKTHRDRVEQHDLHAVGDQAMRVKKLSERAR